jgi:hypothetical protein
MKQLLGSWRRLTPLSILGAFVFFAILWRLDYPKPSYDDLFQAGAAFHMAQGGDFSNPLIVRQEFPGHYYFVYFPLHCYLLAGWLKLFGINTASATAYPMLCCFITSAATIAVLRRHAASVWLEWMVPLGVTFCIMFLGLRAEPPAVALAMAGFALSETDVTRKSASHQFSGLLLLILGATTAPRVTIFVASLGFYVVHRAWRAAANSRERWRVAFWLLASAAAAFLAFLVMIGFHLAEFLRIFHYHAAGRLYRNRLVSIEDYFVHYLGYIQASIIVLPILLLMWAFTKPRDDLNRPAFFLAGAVPLVLWTGGVGHGSDWWAFLMLVLLAGSILRSIPRKQAILLRSVIFLVLAIINRKNFAQTWGLVSGNIRPDCGPEYQAIRSRHPTPEHPMLVDSSTARYVYDYRLPEGVIDAECCERFPGTSPGSYRSPGDSSPQLHNGDIFVIGYFMRHTLEVYTYLDPLPPPKWSFLGLKQLTFEKYPRWVYVIPSENCKGIRTNSSMVLPSNN